MIKQDSLFLGQFDSLMKANFPSSLSISQLFVAIEENKIPLISLNASQTVGIYEALINEINECLPIIREVLASPAYIEDNLPDAEPAPEEKIWTVSEVASDEGGEVSHVDAIIDQILGASGVEV